MNTPVKVIATGADKNRGNVCVSEEPRKKQKCRNFKRKILKKVIL